MAQKLYRSTASVLWMLLFLGIGDRRVAHANPLDAFGLGARNVALGNAVTATVDDSSANYYNPANLTLVRDLLIEIGYLFNQPYLKFDGQDNNVDPLRGIHTGMVIPGVVGPVRFSVGVALFLPDQRVSRIRSIVQRKPRWELYDNRTQRMHITTNGAIELTLPHNLGKLRAGGGITFLTRTEGGLKFQGKLYKEPERALLSTAVDIDFKTVRYPGAGLTWELRDWLSFAVTYRAEAKVSLDLKARVDGVVEFGQSKLPGFFDLISFNTNLFAPHQLFFGSAIRPFPSLLVTLDLGYLLWSRYPPSVAEIEVDLQINGLPLSIDPPTEIASPNFHDIVTVRFGAEYRWQAHAHFLVDFRGGYTFEPTPAPEQTGVTNYADNDKHAFSFGVGFNIENLFKAMPKPLSFDFGAQYIVLPRRDHRKQSAIDLTGDYYSSGSLLTVAATSRVRF